MRAVVQHTIISIPGLKCYTGSCRVQGWDPKAPTYSQLCKLLGTTDVSTHATSYVILSRFYLNSHAYKQFPIQGNREILSSYKYLQELVKKKPVEIKPNNFSAIIDLKFVWVFLPLGRYKFLNSPPGSKSVTTFETLCPSCMLQIRMGLLHVSCLLCSPCDALFTHCTSRYVQQPFPAERLAFEPTAFLCQSLQTLGGQCVPLLPVQLPSVFWVQSEAIPDSGTF